MLILLFDGCEIGLNILGVQFHSVSIQPRALEIVFLLGMKVEVVTLYVEAHVRDVLVQSAPEMATLGRALLKSLILFTTLLDLDLFECFVDPNSFGFVDGYFEVAVAAYGSIGLKLALNRRIPPILGSLLLLILNRAHVLLAGLLQLVENV